MYYNPLTGERIQCDIGTFDNCLTISTGGAVGGPFVGDTTSFDLIPGVLHAYKSQGADLAGFVAAVPAPATWMLLVAGVGLLGFAARRRGV